MRVLLARIQESRREVVVIRGVRIFLGLKSDGLAVVESLSVLSCCGAVKEVSAIELNARTVGKDLHNDRAVRRDHGRSFLYALASVGEYKAVVNTAAKGNILILIGIVCFYWSWADVSPALSFLARHSAYMR